MKLKADLHIHTGEDPWDRDIPYGAEELIDYASGKGYDVLSITNHNMLTYSDHLARYAERKGIILIPGIEVRVQGKDVVLLNFAKEEIERISNLREMANLQREDKLVIAPHPYFPAPHSLNSQFERNISLFDAVEFSGFYFRILNFNGRAERLSKRHGLPMVGSTDSHRLWQLGTTYSLIEAERDGRSIIKGIREGKLEIATKPLDCSIRNLAMAWKYWRGGKRHGEGQGL